MATPRRYQHLRQAGARLPDSAVLCTRSSRWGNPFTVAGRDLACSCPLDQPCHADVLLELANTPAVAAGGSADGRRHQPLPVLRS
jgi:hypothetical protein